MENFSSYHFLSNYIIGGYILKNTNQWFSKNAILSYAGKGREDVIAEKTVSLLNEKLQNVPIITNPAGTQDTDTENNADMDIADAFLDSL